MVKKKATYIEQVKYSENWKPYKLRDLTKIERGKRVVRSQLYARHYKNTIPVYQNSLTPLGYFNTYNCLKNSTFIIAAGNAGDIGFSNENFWAADDCYYFEHTKKIDQKFLYYFLINLQDEICEQSKRTSIPRLSRDILEDLQIMLPEVFEQKAIAAALTALDTYIEDLTALIAKKKDIRDGALEDLVSGRTRLEGFTGEWKEVSFAEVITPKARIGWQGLKKYEYLHRGYSYLIGGTDFSAGTVNLSHIWFVSQERYDMDTNIQVTKDDVLVTKDGTIGKVALVPQLDKPATLNSGVFVFRTTSELLQVFLYRILLSSIFNTFISLLSAGSTIKHLYQKDLKKFTFQIPVDIAEQQAIADTLTAMDEEIQQLEAKRDKMKGIRDGAMDDLLTGRIRLESNEQ